MGGDETEKPDKLFVWQKNYGVRESRVPTLPKKLFRSKNKSNSEDVSLGKKNYCSNPHSTQPTIDKVWMVLEKMVLIWHFTLQPKTSGIHSSLFA